MVERTIYAPIWQLAFINASARAWRVGVRPNSAVPYTSPYEDIT